MVGNFLVGLREGLEAALVVGIIVAYLVRTERHDRLRWVWLGVGSAVIASLGFGAALTFTSKELPERAEPIFAGLASIVAVGFVTWMVFWMKRTAVALEGGLERRVESALAMGAGALVAASFLAVGREGLETALFLWPTIKNANSPTAPAGAFAGLAFAAVLGYLIYKRSVRLDLGKFFRYTGIGLIVVAAGVLSGGVHDLQEADVIGGAHALAFDVSKHVPESSWYGALLKGTINFSAETTWLQLAVWAIYLATVLAFFMHGAARRRRLGFDGAHVSPTVAMSGGRRGARRQAFTSRTSLPST